MTHPSISLAISCIFLACMSSCVLNMTPNPEPIETLQYNNKLTYTIRTYSSNCHELFITIDADQKTANPPEIKVNGKSTNYPTPPTGYQLLYYPFQSGDTVTFTMCRRDSLGSESLSGKFVIPGTIDSLFCNNTYVPPMHEFAAYTKINYPSPFVFTWKSKQASNFSIEYWGGQFYPVVKQLTRDSTLTLTKKEPFDSGNCRMDLVVAAYAGNEFSALDTPMVKSKTMSVFYSLKGQEYVGCVSYPLDH